MEESSSIGSVLRMRITYCIQSLLNTSYEQPFKFWYCVSVRHPMYCMYKAMSIISYLKYPLVISFFSSHSLYLLWFFSRFLGFSLHHSSLSLLPPATLFPIFSIFLYSFFSLIPSPSFPLFSPTFDFITLCLLLGKNTFLIQIL